MWQEIQGETREMGTWEPRNGADYENKCLTSAREQTVTDCVMKLSLAC